MSSTRLHATTVAIGDVAVLLIGASGSGKSDLALRLIDRGAVLVSDDITDLTERDGTLYAAPPATIAGKIEVRGLGIVEMVYKEAMPVALVIRLDGVIERMPPEDRTMAIAGIALPVVALDAFAASTPIAVELALAHAREAR
ncbi:HPr kinase/phosphatase C-terminal domain-containing protein [Sphingomonas sp. RB3P16]|uniref:HPr kinase/phosphorylase n=1 Tax=Parasphingomonas frigoris TaxID=3096163 RepID=UPI002FCB06CB